MHSTVKSILAQPGRHSGMFSDPGFMGSWHADAIIGVSLFSETDPDDFGAFDRAFITLFRVLAGAPWVESIPFVAPDGSTNFKVFFRLL